MLTKIKILIAVAVLSGTVSANVQAATVQNGDTLSTVKHTSLDNNQKVNATTDIIHPGDQVTIAPEKKYTVQQGDTLWSIAMENHMNIKKITEGNKFISDFIHTEDGLNNINNPLTEKDANQANNANATNINAASTNSSSPKEITVKATAYTASCEGCSGITATGVNIKANPDAKVIAVDPKVIPLGSKVYVEGVGEAIAADTGGAIKGNRIDVFVPSEQGAINFGVKYLKVTILN
ncbi:3D domain-containing protein [Neobacillus ginsengisoli]|uniref:3D (Asp-Asp-Asp) domain-containing protein n=1 Tax=Neobacillus ginsengisoli TaxID=904295 RepID=A0ABT9XZV9_9BACI|nr:3D domain-containing protein [Neobacillus ginsengisoli]MDQ0201111.1 3D (Asp-Asp-Asp) domain-containing protein [Neobacillus ginsengisoli]